MTNQEQALEIERLQKQINAMADRISVLKDVGHKVYEDWVLMVNRAGDNWDGFDPDPKVFQDQPEDFVCLG